MLTLTLLFLAGVLQDALITAYTRAVAVRARGAAALIAAATTISSYLLYRYTLFASDGTVRLLAIAAGNAFGTWGLLRMDGHGHALRAALRRARARLRHALRPAPATDIVPLAARMAPPVPPAARLRPAPTPTAFRPADAPTRTCGRGGAQAGMPGRWTASWPAQALRVHARERAAKPPSVPSAA